MKVIFSSSRSEWSRGGRGRIAALVSEAAGLAGLRTDAGQRLSLHFVTSSEIREVNRKFLGHDRPTDVISFDYSRSGISMPGDPVAEIFVSPEAAEAFASGRKGKSYSDEMALYVVHGILHAAGEEDCTSAARRRMRRRERRIIARLRRKFRFTELFPHDG